MGTGERLRVGQQDMLNLTHSIDQLPQSRAFSISRTHTVSELRHMISQASGVPCGARGHGKKNPLPNGPKSVVSCV